MTEKEFQFQKKREVGEIIGDSFEFLKEEFRPISALVLRYVFPFILLYGGFQVYLQLTVLENIDFSDPERFFSNLGPLYMNILLSSLFAVFVQSLLVGTYYSFIKVYVEKGKGNFTLEDISTPLFSNTLQALIANLALYFLVLLGVMMCILPGIYIANTLSPIVMVVLFEKKGLADAINRTWKLVNTNWWNTFILNLLGVVVIQIAGFVVTLPASVLGLARPAIGGEINFAEVSMWYWVLAGLSAVVSSLFWLVPYTFLAFQYFNLRERNEPAPPANVG